MMQPIVPPAYSEAPKTQRGADTQNVLIAGYNQGQDQGHQPYPLNGCPQIIYQPVALRYENFKSRQSLALSIGQIIAGVVCIVFNSVLFAPLLYTEDDVGTAPIGHGIWGGVFFIIAGGFGIWAARTKSKCTIIAFMVLCIISALAAAVIFSLGILDAVITYGGALALNILLIIFAAFEGALAIWGSILCCKAAACCSTLNVSTFVLPLPGQPVQYVPVNRQSAMLVAATPFVQQYNAGFPAGYPMMQFAGAGQVYQPPAGIQASYNQPETFGR